MQGKASNRGNWHKRAAMSIAWILMTCLYAYTLAACSGAQHKDDNGDELATEVKIDCTQEANKYRKPCRGNRW